MESKKINVVNLRKNENLETEDKTEDKNSDLYFKPKEEISVKTDDDFLNESDFKSDKTGVWGRMKGRIKSKTARHSEAIAEESRATRGELSRRDPSAPLRSAQDDREKLPRDPSAPVVAQDDREKIRSAQDGKISGIFDKAIACLLYLLVFLLPIFVLPFSMEIYEFNKTLLLFVISSLAFLLWLIKMILIDRRAVFVKTPLNTPIIIFISVVLISTVFSVDKTSSMLGFYGRFSDSLMVYLSLAMMYFVVVNCVKPTPSPSQEGNNNLIKAFLASSFIVAITGLIYFFGFKFIPWEEAQFRSFNLVGGSLNVFGVYLTAVILITLGYRSRAGALAKRLMSLLVIISLILLMFIDFVLAWIVLAVSLFVVLALGIVNAKTRQRLVSTGLIFLISLVFIASSLIIINKKIQPDVQLNSEAIFTESLISKSIKKRLISNDDNQIAREDAFTREVILDKKTAALIAVEGVKKDLFAGVIGSGPGTYLYNFSKFKPAEFNNNAFWNIRFDKAGSEIIEKASTIGILGVLAYLAIVILAMGMFLKMLLWAWSKDKNCHSERSGAEPKNPVARGENCNIKLCETNTGSFDSSLAQDDKENISVSAIYIFAAWFGLLLFQFMYLEATTTKFIFWLLTAILAGEYVVAKRFHSPNGTMEPTIINLKKDRSAFYSALGALLIFVFILANSYYHQAKFYLAEAGYKTAVLDRSEALKSDNLTEEQVWEVLNQNVSDMEKVIKRNPQRGDYKIYLSDIYFNRASLVFQEENKKAEDERNTQQIALEVKNAIDHAKSAADTSPNNIIFQQKLASVYASLDKNIGVVGAKEWAVKKYRNAIKLEPNNPVIYTELGKIYISAGETDAAIKEFEKALELKENYLDAGLQLGLAYETRGNSQKAISQLISLGSVERIDSVIAAGQVVSPVGASLDIDAAFQLGRIYYNEGRNSEAKNLFLKIAKINSTHSNARYSLGLIYEKEGEYELALREFEIVSAMNPQNEEVKSKISELKKRGVNEISNDEEIVGEEE